MRRVGVSGLCTLIIIFMMISLFMFVGCSKKNDEEEAANQPVVIDSGMRKTVLYFEDASGLLVPVMKRIPWEAGIGSAALHYLVNTPENAASSATMGLMNVLPETTNFSLKIDDALATVNVKDVGDLETAQQESNAICAVVNTLLEFPSIDTVKVLIDGQSDVTLAHGTNLAQVFSTQDLNVEASASSMQSLSNKVLLYFASANSELNVPVTRFLYNEPSLESAVLELIKGPYDLDALKCCFPEGTQVKSIDVTDSVATVDFSKEFEQIREHPELEQRAIETLNLTCRQFEGVETVLIKVEGKEYKTDASTLAPVFANEF